MKSKFLPFLLLLAVLPVLIFRDYTPSNELRYLSIVDEALRNGDIFTFTNHGIQSLSDNIGCHDKSKPNEKKRTPLEISFKKVFST